MSFGETLRKIREDRSMNQSELAALLGTTRQTINRYERSEREPNIRTAASYAKILGISLEELTGQIEQPATVSDSGLWKEICQDERKLRLAQWIAGLNQAGLDRMEKLLDLVEMLPKE